MKHARLAGERGAITIHVAIALIAMLAYVSFVADYGVMWVARRQAQNAADAGALSGAITLMNGGLAADAKLAALQFASENAVWAEANTGDNVEVAVSGQGPGETSIPPCGGVPGCVRVDVFRNEPDRSGTVKGSALPTFFGQIVGVTGQGIRATATAQVTSGNSIQCLLPFAVIDRWADNYDDNIVTTYFPNDGQGLSSDPTSTSGVAGWTANDDFQPPSLSPPHSDLYIPPYSGNSNTTGWTVSRDYGYQLILKSGSVGHYSAGWANEIDLPNSTGSNDYRWNIENCNPQPVGIATASETCSAVDYPNGCVSIKTGMSAGPTKQGIASDTASVVNQDPTAHWDASATASVGLSGAVVDGSGVLDMSSPRIRPIVVIDINNYISSGCSGTTCIGKVANIIGFFVEGMCDAVSKAGELDFPEIASCPDPTKDVVGRIVTLPGTFATGVGTVENSSAFIKVIRLVR